MTPNTHSKIIMQTWKNEDLIGAPLIYTSIHNTWKFYHPDWEYVFLDDKAIEQFMKDKYTWFYENIWTLHYERIILKADAIRYFFLFDRGGIYSDMDNECLGNFDDLLKSTNGTVILGQLPDYTEHSIPNALMISKKPYHIFWLVVIKFLILNAMESYGSIEERTGPVLLTKALLYYNSTPTKRVLEFVSDMMMLRNIDLNKLVYDKIIIMPSHVFYPLSWQRHMNLCKQESARRILMSQYHTTLKKKYPQSLMITYWVHGWS